MSDSETSFLHTGKYTDYSRLSYDKTQWLVSADAAFYLTNLFAILVSVALPRLLRIALRFIRHHGSNSSAINSTRVWFGQDEHAAEEIGWHSLLEGATDLAAARIVLPTAANQPSQMAQIRKRDGIAKLAVGSSWIILYLSFFVASIVTAKLASDSRALSQHPDCGVYSPKGFNSSSSDRLFHPWEFSVETESSERVRNCYTGLNTDACQLFVAPYIPRSMENWTCPFPDHMCYGNGVAPVRMSTGVVDARSIGINAPITYEFNRTTICSPLNMNRTYVNLSSRNGSTYHFGYYYGSSEETSEENATWISHRYGNIGDDASYLVNVQFSWSNTTGMPWIPIPELVPPDGATTTIIFIVSQKIFYPQPSYDPIFPAKDPTTLPRYPNEQFYWNIAGPGTAMACQDHTMWRDPTSVTKKWFPITKLLLNHPPHSQTTGAQILLWYALTASSTFSSIISRGHNALDAQSRIANTLSLPLSQQQWAVEADSLFNTSLARIEVGLHNIARGIGKRRGFKKLSTVAPICEDTYVFNADGWTNINFSISMTVCIVSTVIIVLAIPAKAEELWPEVLFGIVRQWSIWSRLRNAGHTLYSLAKRAWTAFIQTLSYLFALIRAWV